MMNTKNSQSHNTIRQPPVVALLFGSPIKFDKKNNLLMLKRETHMLYSLQAQAKNINSKGKCFVFHFSISSSNKNEFGKIGIPTGPLRYKIGL